jgi:hypothetical protein
VLPSSLIIGPIGVYQFSSAVLLVFKVLSLISFASRPAKQAVSMHLVLEPLTLILSTVLELHDSLPFSFATLHHPRIGISIVVKKFARSRLLVELIVAFKDGTIRPGLLTFSVALVFLPAALILAASDGDVDAITVSLIVLPLTFIVIAVGMMQSSLPLSLIVPELSRIVAFIGEEELPIAIFLAMEPLSIVVAIFIDLDGS